MWFFETREDGRSDTRFGSPPPPRYAPRSGPGRRVSRLHPRHKTPRSLPPGWRPTLSSDSFFSGDSTRNFLLILGLSLLRPLTSSVLHDSLYPFSQVGLTSLS